MKAYPVTVLCRVMRVRRSGFYDFIKRIQHGPGNDPVQESLKSRVRQIFKLFKSSYGSRRTAEQLQIEGYEVGRYKARRLMRDLGLKVKAPRRYKRPTTAIAFMWLLMY